MTSDEARKILILYRPGTADGCDLEFAEALEAVLENDELRVWFQRHCAAYDSVREKLRGIQPPGGLKERIVTGRGAGVPFSWRENPLFWAAAAAVILIGVVLSVQRDGTDLEHYENFRSRMVGMALRQYGMDVVTNRSEVVRQFLEEQGAPSDYELPPGLERLSLSGGGALSWRGNPVSMICFDRGDRQMLFLFVVDREPMREAPGVAPEVMKVNRLLTAGWSRGDRVYLLAGPEEEGFGRKYAPADREDQ